MGRLHFLAASVLFPVNLIPSAVSAATLQVSPVMVEFRPSENASSITLRNPGDHPLYGQVRMFRWDQVNGNDTLTPSQDLIASPPLVEIPPHADQLVRLVRASATPVAVEQSFRILIDELPPPGEVSVGGVTIRLRYSVPIFIEPPNMAGVPQLAWHLSKSAMGWTLSVDNTGVRRAQIAAVELVNGAGNAYQLNEGLLGYALAGRTVQWNVPLPATLDLSDTVKVRAVVNSLPVKGGITLKQPG
ncbi:fimbrial biogenesis chaperone [Trinickia fusca]|uniref:Molecular chaperone n=1 Tax=Trinickia fusca TaxID=2419777 RepID=A0A494XQ15_9BURK|nr:molecular chaperone [Trinickia fusca]RKP52725.1 molecular chaperone [Trinickia fusca]